MSTTPSSQSKSRLRRFWDWLTLPQENALLEPAKQKDAQLAASTALLLAFLLVGNFLSTQRLPSLDSPQESIRLLVFVIFLLSYLLARTRLYRLGGWLMLLSINLLGYGYLLLQPRQPLESVILIIVTFIPIGLAISAALLPPVGIFFFSLLHFVAIVFLPSLHPSLAQNMAFATGGGLLTSGILFSLLVVFRNERENEGLEQLQTANEELGRIQVTLEERVEERTAELNRRSTQLETAALVARSAAEVRDLKTLLENVVNQITERFGFYHAGLFLTEPNSQYVVLQAASSEGGKRMLERGHRLEIGRQGIVGYAAYQKRPRIAQNVGADAAYFNNPDLPLTRSEIAMPLEVQNNLIGVLDIQSETEHAFASEDVYSLQAMADQIALAIENARLIEETRNLLAQLQKNNTQSVSSAWRDRLASPIRGFIYHPTGVDTLRPGQTLPETEEGLALRIPISLRGQPIGSILLQRKPGARPWGKNEQEIGEKIALQAALAVENARLLEETQRRALREQTLNELSSRFSRSLDVETLLQNAARELQRLPQVAAVSVVVAPQDPNTPLPREA